MALVPVDPRLRDPKVSVRSRARGRGMVSVLPVRSAEFRAAYRLARQHRVPGGLFTDAVYDRLGSVVAAAALRRGIHPSLITGAGLLVALATGGLVIGRAGEAHFLWAAGWVGFLGWQLAYALDCADGQVARAAGQQSDFGARLDVLTDFLVHSSIIWCLVTLIARWSHVPTALLAVFATSWFVNLLIFVLSRSDRNSEHAFFTSDSLMVRAVKLLRDYGLILFTLSCTWLLAPRSMILPVLFFTLLDSCFLVGSITREAWLSMRRPSQPPRKLAPTERET